MTEFDAEDYNDDVEVDPEDYYDDDELDLEVPLDGRDGQPPEEGSSDEPETLEQHDPLHKRDPLLVDTDATSTVIGTAVEPTEDELIDTEHFIEEDPELDEDLDEPQ